MTIPIRTIIHVSGIPASRKTTFCRYLEREHGFAHYELENFPRGWLHPELHPRWNRDRALFVRELRRLYDRVAIEWGFPPRLRAWVDELAAAGMRLVWFQADIDRAREALRERSRWMPDCSKSRFRRSRTPDCRRDWKGSWSRPFSGLGRRRYLR